MIVSNDSAAGVETYPMDRGLLSPVHRIFQRPKHRPDLMRPNPALVRDALDYLAVPAGHAQVRSTFPDTAGVARV